MCGRFSLTSNEAELNLRFELEGGAAPYVPRYNGAPTQLLAVITNENPGKLSYHRWGLIPTIPACLLNCPTNYHPQQRGDTRF
jgi:putative SOS response-associated peptidase YedK